MLEKNYSDHSCTIQYSVFHKKIQIINGRKDNHSIIGSTKINEYTADSCTTYGRVNTKSSCYEAFVLDARTLFCKMYEMSHNSCFQDNGHNWIKWDN